ncbi:MAG: pyrimidine/purine nucleoside phosphorylase [Bacteroidales bacterium]|nr:pyrimidine/purine nucleoside phosphorylase [Bacteroidales bacterium]MCF8404586.1 pyrimidine/purine nucleoside phosphorylase [Bacteroidales bacterium]
MLKNNEYFDGKVKSIGFENEDGVATVGVMEAGEYEFGTSTDEFMTVTSGTMEVLLTDAENWKTFSKGDHFFVGKNKSFKVKSAGAAAYLCIYR